VFDKDLLRSHITALKDVLVRECEDFDEAQANKGITFEAFKAMQNIMLRKLKMEVPWKILRYFGYDNALNIERSLWDDQTVSDEDIKQASSIELQQGCV
jgi:hypothetical protein